MAKFKPGVSGNPEKIFKPGNAHRFPKGTSGSPGGFTKRRQEFEQALRDALFQPELLSKAVAALEKAINAGEPWATQWYLNKIWPDTPASIRMSAGMSVEVTGGDDAILESFYRRITECAARVQAERDHADAGAGEVDGASVRVELLGAPEST
jgi:hypothetical protein